jgi:hypothetical protein
MNLKAAKPVKFRCARCSSGPCALFLIADLGIPVETIRIRPETQKPALGKTKAQEGPITVLIYVDTSKQVGEADYLKVFANSDAAETCFEENDPEGVAFEYEVLE